MEDVDEHRTIELPPDDAHPPVRTDDAAVARRGPDHEDGPDHDRERDRARARGRGPWTALGRTAIVAAAVVVVLLGGLLILVNATGDLLGSLNPFRDGVIQSRTVDRSGPAVVKSISELGQLKAASGYYEVLVDVEKDIKPLPSFLAGRRTLLVAAGTVDATVDLSGLDGDAITTDADRTSVTVTVPAPVLGKPALDLDRTRVWGTERGLLDRLQDAFGDGTDDGPAGQEALYAAGSRRIGEAARQSPELARRAQDSATATLTGLLRGLGFTDVTVVFEKPDSR